MCSYRHQAVQFSMAQEDNCKRNARDYGTTDAMMYQLVVNYLFSQIEEYKIEDEAEIEKARQAGSPQMPVKKG